jgi:hypothetical protein
MVARNPKDHNDQWYVAKAYFEDNLELAAAADTDEGPTEVEKARDVMRQAFEADRDLMRVYLDKIAMCLYDKHGVTDKGRREAAAQDIIDLIFYS